MMIVTTFSFDTNSNWNPYAMIMPISKNDLVASKFLVLFAFSAIGAMFGFIVGMVGGLLLNKFAFHPANILELAFLAVMALIIAMVYGGMSIPLVIKFGADKGRMLLLVSFLVPAAICFLIYQILLLLGISMTDRLVWLLSCCAPVAALLWNYLMYKISCRIFTKQEL